MSIFKPVTVVTGASVGIGAALAGVFARNGHEVALVARREKEMVLLANELAVVVQIQAACHHGRSAALGRAGAHRARAARARARARDVVNNAGFGLHGHAAELDRGEQLAMLDLNVRALTDLSLRWIDGIVKHKGGILNVASVAGFLPGPGMAVYYAVESLCAVLHRGAGARARAARRARDRALSRPGADRIPEARRHRAKPTCRLLARTPETVAQAGYDGFMAGKRLVIPGFGNRLVSFLPRLLPRGMVFRAIERYQRGRGVRRRGLEKAAEA